MTTESRITYLKLLTTLAIVILAVSALVFGYDLLRGDGDGINARLGINPCTLIVTGGVLLLLLRGLISKQKWLAQTSTLLLSSLLTLAVIEFILPSWTTDMAVVHKNIEGDNGTHPYTFFDSVYFKNYVPGCSFTYFQFPEDSGRQLHHTINSDAMRSPEIAAKQADEKRILLIGDSYIQSIRKCWG